MSTKVLTDRVKEFQITRWMVDRFRYSTQDGNDLHKEVEGQEGIVPGFQIGGFLTDFADEYRQELAKNLQLIVQESQFLKPVRVGSTVIAEIKEVIAGEDEYKIAVSMRKKGQSDPVSRSILTYGKSLPKAEKEQRNSEYFLDFKDAQGVALGLGKQGIDIAKLAYGLASNALYTDGKALVDKAAEQGKLPIYARHKLYPHSPLGENPSERLSIEDSIIISTNAQDVAQTVARRTARKEREMRRGQGASRRDHNVYTTDVCATTPTGSVVYNAKLTLLFMTKEEVLKDA